MDSLLSKEIIGINLGKKKDGWKEKGGSYSPENVNLCHQGCRPQITQINNNFPAGAER
jgi:hypothetical protein